MSEGTFNMAEYKKAVAAAIERDAIKVNTGTCCARCGVEFDGAHEKPVLCYSCHGQSPAQPLPKAWLEEKAK